HDRVTIAKSSTLPYDSAPRVTSPATDKGTERASDDTEEMATVLTSIDATTVLASGAVEVPTGSGSIPTAGPLLLRRRKGKEVMVETDTPKK
nr:hypothetical protein [Tanacetum cinerariifolium]